MNHAAKFVQRIIIGFPSILFRYESASLAASVVANNVCILAVGQEAKKNAQSRGFVRHSETETTTTRRRITEVSQMENNILQVSMMKVDNVSKRALRTSSR